MCSASDVPAGAISWFEPPASDIGAALSFYHCTLETFLSGGGVPTRASRIGDATAYRAVPDIVAAIARSVQAGGKALTEIIDLPAGIGRIAHMLEADGNRVGLHQPGALA